MIAPEQYLLKISILSLGQKDYLVNTHLMQRVGSFLTSCPIFVGSAMSSFLKSIKTIQVKFALTAGRIGVKKT